MDKERAIELILSICIPTYNQPKGLRRSLESLLGQVPVSVEIVVRDDSTNDEGKKVIEDFSEKMPIRYFRGKKEGVDSAIIFLTEEAKGKYVWWFGDDVMLPGTVKKFLDLVDEHPEITFMYINSGGEDGDEKSISSINGSRFFKDKEEVVDKIGGFLGFCSATPFLRSIAVQGISGARKYAGSAFVTLYLATFVVSKGDRGYFLDGKNFWSDPKPPDTPTWYDPFLVYGVNFFRIINEFRGCFSDESLDRLISRNLEGVCRSILVYRAKGYKNGYGSGNPKLKILTKLYWRYPKFWQYFPLLILPRFFVTVFYKTYKLFFRKTKTYY